MHTLLIYNVIYPSLQIPDEPKFYTRAVIKLNGNLLLKDSEDLGRFCFL